MQLTKSLEVRAELEQVQSTHGLAGLRAELERLRAELKEVRESGLGDSSLRGKRLEDDGRCRTERMSGKSRKRSGE